jgi:flagellar biosynthesis/type III secretory pathway M-ring protein FliF/YscJ
METQQISLGKHFWGLGVSFLTLLVGGWLMIAPYALGYQPYGSSWLAQTKNDFWTGLAVAIFSLLSLALIAASLIADLRAAGVIQERQKTEPLPEAETVPEQAAAEDDFERAMTKLASVLADDLAEKHRKDSEQAAAETLMNSNARRQV